MWEFIVEILIHSSFFLAFLTAFYMTFFVFIQNMKLANEISDMLEQFGYINLIGSISTRYELQRLKDDIQNYNQGDWLEPTKDLLVYDENDELKPITKLFVNGFAETYEVSDENGNTYEFTAEHKVKVTGKGWVRVDELSEGDDVVKF